MFRLVVDTHLSDIGCLYWETLQQHACCHILRMGVNGVSTIFSLSSWVIYVLIGCRHPFIRYWLSLLGKTTATCSLPQPQDERQRSINNLLPRILGHLCSDWLRRTNNHIMAAFTGNNYSGMLPAACWEWAATEHQQFLASHLGLSMFQLVVDIHLSDIGCLYWEQLQRHARSRTLRLSVHRVSTMFICEYWVIYFPIGYRHPFIKYWQPLLAKTTVTCSLPHPENEHQQSVNRISGIKFGNQGITLNSAFITELLTAVIGNNTMFQR